ncbi:hypothetical protein LX36DRAFT_714667 [Colletotrichum falcatum]|nr:hypothetical protein LX36DRAFT_714667 [Colletotrichum falcatum]
MVVLSSIQAAVLELLQVFDVAYDPGVFPTERHCVQLLGIYLGLAYTGARPGELVNNEKARPKDGPWKDLFPSRDPDDPCDEDEQVLDEDSRILEAILIWETTDRGRPKALCYKGINLIVIRHPENGLEVLAMSVKFVHHKGASKPRKHVPG